MNAIYIRSRKGIAENYLEGKYANQYLAKKLNLTFNKWENWEKTNWERTTVPIDIRPYTMIYTQNL